MRRPSISSIAHSFQVPTVAGPKEGTTPSVFKHHHALLLVLLNTVSALLFKILPAFVVYIKDDYGFSYSFTISAISMGSLATMSSFILIPPLLHLPINLLFCLTASSQCISCFLFWFFRHSHITFIIAVILESVAQMVTFGCSNAVISTFVTNPDVSHKYLATIYAGWTISTFLFFGVGYIMKIGSFWLFLEIMFAICLSISLLSLIFLPKQSTNRHNLGQSDLNKISISSDLKVISQIKPFWLINLSFILNFTAWGYFYSSFGRWLEGTFDLTEAHFGYIAGLCEGIGDGLADLTVAFLVRSNVNDTSWYKLSLQSMMFWTALIGTSSLATISMTIFMGWNHRGFLYPMIGVFFFGHEASTNAGLILICKVLPAIQQGRAFAFIGIVQSLTIFVAQVTVSQVYEIGGMKWESVLISMMGMVATIDIGYLVWIMRTSPNNQEDILLEKSGSRNACN